MISEDRQKRWNDCYLTFTFNPDDYVDWLSPYLVDIPLGDPIIELGCGFGYLSGLLFAKGYNVLATDISPVALDALAKRVSGIRTRLVDIQAPLPFCDDSFRVVIADLCLHYFERQTTYSILEEVARILRPDGILCARVNSMQDYNYGAGVGRRIEQGFFEQDGHFKRYFDKLMVKDIFCMWAIVSLANYDIFQYDQPKNVFEIIARPLKQGPDCG